MKQQYMLIGLPSSGSDWLAGILCAINIDLQVDTVAKEFFNPICNPKHYKVLATSYGCELLETQRHIADTLWHQRTLTAAEEAYEASWATEGHTFTKEVFSPFRVPFLAKRFQLLGLVRRAEYTFPPKRLRVLNWYDAIWQSLVYHQRRNCWIHDAMVATMVDHAQQFASQSLLLRAVAAHTIARRVAIRDLREAGVVTMDWHALMTYAGQELAEYVARGVSDELQPGRIAHEIEQTRLASNHELTRRAVAFANTGCTEAQDRLDQIADGYGA